MKVLHIIPTYYPAYARGGPIWSVHNLNKWLVKNGLDVTVYTTDLDVSKDIPRNREVNIDGVKIFYFPVSFPKVWKFWRVGFIPAFLPRHWEYSQDLHKALSENIGKFDLIHITSTFLFASTLGAYYARNNNIPYIISPRGSLMKKPVKKKGLLGKIFYIGLIEERNLQNAAAIHFTVPQEKKEYEELGFIYNESIVTPNGIDPENFESAPRGYFREKFNIPENKKIILFLSRITWKKGLDTLIPAFAKVKKAINQKSKKAVNQEINKSRNQEIGKAGSQESDVILVIAGGDDEGYKKRVEKWIKENNIENNVIFTGMITGKDKTAVYQDSDVFVLPSYSENFGMAVVEAMYFGLPVVITEEVGISPEIRKNNAGLVVKKDEDQIAGAILKIFQNENFAKDLGERGKKLVSQKYVMSKIADEWVEAYKNIINNHEEI